MHYKRMPLILLVFVIGMLVTQRSDIQGVEETTRTEIRIEPNPKIQADISRVMNVTLNKKESAAEYCEAIASLWDYTVDPGDEEFFRQLFLFAELNRDIEEVALYIGVLAQRLAISELAMIRVCMPYIYAEDEQLRETAIEFLEYGGGVFEDSKLGNFYDYTEFENVLDRNLDETEFLLVRFMYEKSPGDALLAMRKNFSDKSTEHRDVLWSEHVIGDVMWKGRNRFRQEFEEGIPVAIQELQKLSTHEAWWARLYVAELLRRYPQFRTTEIIDRLKTDEHELVKQAIARIDAQKNKPKPKSRPVPRDNDTDDTEALNDADPGMPPGQSHQNGRSVGLR